MKGVNQQTKNRNCIRVLPFTRGEQKENVNELYRKILKLKLRDYQIIILMQFLLEKKQKIIYYPYEVDK
jgi:hypothetical protein